MDTPVSGTSTKSHGPHRHIVLIGAGHAHVEVLRRFRLRPDPSVRLTLVTPSRDTSYSGMLPGYVAGHYSRADIHIRVDRLADFAGCAVIFQRAIELEANTYRVGMADGSSICGDVISIDVGARAAISLLAGSSALIVSAKPMDDFEHGWAKVEPRLQTDQDISFGIVGGGGAGVELALAIRYRLGRLRAGAPRGARIVLLERSHKILPGFSAHARKRLIRILAAHGIDVRTDTDGSDGETSDREFSVLIMAGGVRPVDWLSRSGLATDEAGYIAVNRHLQSISHPEVFAAGDAAGMIETPRPKSGVMAVRQGPVLAQNLRRMAHGLALKPFLPQQEWLNLISTGEQYAVASRGRWSAEGRWVWRWKDWIDRRFVRRFQF
jgi:selenide,water dikinase